MIRATSVSKWYGDVIAVNGLDLDIGHGVTGLVGPNGSGKSTAFKLIAGAIRPSSGSVTVLDQDPWNNDALMSRLGFCPDFDFLPLELTGERYLGFVGGLHGLSGASLRDRVSEVSDVVGMSEELGRSMKGYSKGMRQRLKIAGSIIHDPELLLLDEPLAGTDPLVRRDLIDLVHRLHEDHGHDVIVSSHVLHEMERMTSSIVLVYKGRRVASGEVRDIRALMNRYPHNIVVTGSGMRKLAKRLLDEDYTVTVGIADDRLDARVSDPEGFFGDLPRLVTESGCRLETLKSLDDDLESVFKYLVGW